MTPIPSPPKDSHHVAWLHKQEQEPGPDQKQEPGPGPGQGQCQMCMTGLTPRFKGIIVRAPNGSFWDLDTAEGCVSISNIPGIKYDTTKLIMDAIINYDHNTITVKYTELYNDVTITIISDVLY